MPANDGMTDRRRNAEFFHGAALDGTVKQIAPDRGGFVEYAAPLQRSREMQWPYGFPSPYDVPGAEVEMFDHALRVHSNHPTMKTGPGDSGPIG